MRSVILVFVVLPCFAFVSGCSNATAPPVAPVVSDAASEPSPPALNPPSFCWLAFGSEGQRRILVSYDGRSLHLDDRMGTEGKTDVFPTLADCKGATISDPDGQTRYIIHAVEDMGFVSDLGRGLAIEVEVAGPLPYWQGAQVRLGRSVDEAPVVHLHAPLTFGLYAFAKATPTRRVEWQTQPPKLARGRTAILSVQVQNLEKRPDCNVVVAATDESGRTGRFPAAVRPVAEIEFPPVQVGGEAVRRRYVLNEVCCGSNFYGAVDVPTEAGTGIARVTLSFDAWSSGRVQPKVIELPVTDAPPMGE